MKVSSRAKNGGRNGAIALALGISLGGASFGSRAQAQDKPAAPAPEKIQSITDRQVDDLVKDLSGTDTERAVAENELPRRGKTAIAPLVNCLTKGPTAESRLSAAKLLRKLRAAEAAPALLAVYKDASAPLEVRGEAARGLGEVKAAEAIPTLVEGLSDNMFKVSETARRALRDMGQLAIDPIIAAYRKELAAKDAGREGVIFRSILLMGEIPCDKSRDVLLETLKTTEGPRAIGLRHHAAIALGLLQDKLAIEPLIEAYEKEREFRVGMAIDRSLAWLTGEQGVPPQAYRWKAWWAANKDRFFPKNKDKYDDIYIPKGGVQKGTGGDKAPPPAPPADKKDAPADKKDPKK